MTLKQLGRQLLSQQRSLLRTFPPSKRFSYSKDLQRLPGNDFEVKVPWGVLAGEDVRVLYMEKKSELRPNARDFKAKSGEIKTACPGSLSMV